MSIEGVVLVLVSAVFINNFVFAKFLGVCPFIGVSKDLKSALGMGMAVTFVLAMASVVTYLVYEYLLVVYDVKYLKTIAFILVIASFVQLVEIILQKFSPALHKSLGIYLPLITTNCAVLGAATINVQKNFNLLMSTVYGVGAGLGFTMALLLMAGLREQLNDSRIPRPLRGAPIAFITAGLMSMAFMGFTGIIKE